MTSVVILRRYSVILGKTETQDHKLCVTSNDIRVGSSLFPATEGQFFKNRYHFFNANKGRIKVEIGFPSPHKTIKVL